MTGIPIQIYDALEGMGKATHAVRSAEEILGNPRLWDDEEISSAINELKKHRKFMTGMQLDIALQVNEALRQLKG